MTALRRKNHTLESLLGSRVPFDELTPELYLLAKEARISDDKIANLCGVRPMAINQFKHDHDLIGVTIPGYENNSVHNRKQNSGQENKEDEDVKIVEGVANESTGIFSEDVAELRVKLSAVTHERDHLEKILMSKDEEIHRLNEQAAQFQEHLNQASQLIRQLEAENEQLQSIGSMSDLVLEEDNRVINEKYDNARSIIKQLATLI